LQCVESERFVGPCYGPLGRGVTVSEGLTKEQLKWLEKTLQVFIDVSKLHIETSQTADQTATAGAHADALTQALAMVKTAQVIKP